MAKLNFQQSLAQPLNTDLMHRKHLFLLLMLKIVFLLNISFCFLDSLMSRKLKRPGFIWNRFLNRVCVKCMVLLKLNAKTFSYLRVLCLLVCVCVCVCLILQSLLSYEGGVPDSLLSYRMTAGEEPASPMRKPATCKRWKVSVSSSLLFLHGQLIFWEAFLFTVSCTEGHWRRMFWDKNVKDILFFLHPSSLLFFLCELSRG